MKPGARLTAWLKCLNPYYGRNKWVRAGARHARKPQRIVLSQTWLADETFQPADERVRRARICSLAGGTGPGVYVMRDARGKVVVTSARRAICGGVLRTTSTGGTKGGRDQNPDGSAKIAANRGQSYPQPKAEALLLGKSECDQRLTSRALINNST